MKFDKQKISLAPPLTLAGLRPSRPNLRPPLLISTNSIDELAFPSKKTHETKT